MTFSFRVQMQWWKALIDMLEFGKDASLQGMWLLEELLQATCTSVRG